MRRRTITSGLSVAALTTGLTVLATGHASADPDWDELAQCESGGNWQSTAGHFEGGIQFDPGTWDAYGGGQYASSADRATREQQIAIGRKVLAAQGYSAWPGCSAKTNWENGGGSSPARHAPSSHADHTARSSTHARAVVKEASAAPAVQHLVVPRQAVPSLNVPKTAPPGGSMWTVGRGDTLNSIAAKNPGVTWQQILELNRDVVEHPDWIFPGERLAIPAPLLTV